MARQVTITLDEDDAARLDREVERSGRSVDQGVNDALDATLVEHAPRARKPFKVHAKNLGPFLIDVECTGRVLEYLDDLELSEKEWYQDLVRSSRRTPNPC